MKVTVSSGMALLHCAVAFTIGAAEKAETHFVATPLTEEGAFTEGIEGPACDEQGNIYAVNFARQQTIGKVTPDGKATVFVDLPGKSVGNGIRFDRQGIMFVADYVGHNVLRIDPATRAITVFAHQDDMNQPNDLAITSDGTLYASDPNWKTGTGQVWRIDKDGSVKRVAEKMGTSNGIEVSPDGRTLYVNESVQRNVWAFAIARDGSLADKRLLKKFDEHGFDGMRCDVDGNLYITRHGKGTVVKLSPKGEVLKEIDVLGPLPSNICFGGPDGCTAYVTEVKHRRLVQFRVDRPGLEWRRSTAAISPSVPMQFPSPAKQEIVGIGAIIVIDPNTGTPMINGVLPNSPAAAAGLAGKLLIRKIDDALTDGIKLQECVNLLRGAAGTKVRLELFDLDSNEARTVELTRQKVQLQSAPSAGPKER